MATAILLVLIASILLVLVGRLGCDTWRGAGFSLGGPEMPRLREVLTLRVGICFIGEAIPGFHEHFQRAEQRTAASRGPAPVRAGGSSGD
jgi:hypothetical protein